MSRMRTIALASVVCLAALAAACPVRPALGLGIADHCDCLAAVQVVDAIRTDASVPAHMKVRLAFQYDHQGRRLRKEVFHWDAQAAQWVSQWARRFVYDGWLLLAELSDEGQLLRSYAWGPDVSHAEAGAGGIGGLLAVRDHLDERTYWPVSDANGNVVALVDAADQSVAATYEYAPFGQLLHVDGPAAAWSNPAAANPFLFSTKYFDAETGLYYYGYRYYDPRNGKWLSRDPLAEEGGLNLYGFCTNDPINTFDPFGLENWFTRLCTNIDDSINSTETGRKINAAGKSATESACRAVGTGYMDAMTAIDNKIKGTQLGREMDAAFAGSAETLAELANKGGFDNGPDTHGKAVVRAVFGLPKSTVQLAGGIADTVESGGNLIHWWWTKDPSLMAQSSLNSQMAVDCTKAAVEFDREIEQTAKVGKGYAACLLIENGLRRIPVAGKIGSNIGDAIIAGEWTPSNTQSAVESGIELAVVVRAAQASGIPWTRTPAPQTTAITLYDPKFALQQGAPAEAVVPNAFPVVRGGTAPPPPPGTVFSGSMGRTVTEAASGVPHGSIQTTTAGAIRQGGGSVSLVPEPIKGVLNRRHVNVVEKASPTVFNKPVPNPVPKHARLK